MATKKINEKDNLKTSSWFQRHPEISGILLLAFVICQVLGLVSFKSSNPHANWMGWIGHVTSLFWYKSVGLGAWWLLGLMAIIGWKQLIHSVFLCTRRNRFASFLMTVALCVLLSVVSNNFPQTEKSLASFIGFDSEKTGEFRMGGLPFYFWYADIPFVNLKHALNSTGTSLVCSLALLIGIGIISHFSFVKLIIRFREWVKNCKEEAAHKINSQFEQLSQATTLREDNKDLSRFVKVRSHTWSENDDGESGPDHDVIAIQPELNLKARPSVSRKESLDLPPSFANIPSSFGLKQTDRPATLGKEEKAPTPKPRTPYTEPTIEKKQTASDSSSDKRRQALKAQAVANGDYTNYRLPSLDSLSEAKKIDTSSLKKDLKRKAEVLEETLLSFGIEAKVGQINYGPSITSFEVHPAVGVKVQRIKAVENDLALNLEAKSIRIIAPIPGKAAVGIEVPNAQPQEVGFKEILSAYQQSKPFKIPVLLGKAVNGDLVTSDLTKMPHCIIAGATGSGKSVCINTIVMSIVMNAKPDEIKLLMVDPKKVELTPYSQLPHMLAPVITEPSGACNALNWLVKEMETRYEILKVTGQRNIESFNHRQRDAQFESSLEIDIPEKMAYYVAIIDELADLMMVSSHDIETPIARIAQMARAVGIHLILATQRPSREVITGLIKANFPTRICFKVASRVNSQIVLDETGAESLLGNGDMLFLPPGSSTLIRTQGAYIRDEDINRVIRFIKEQAPCNYLIKSFDTLDGLDLPESIKPTGPVDALYEEAKEIVLSTNNASTTFLQRKLKIGYARAASLIDELEAQGIIGPAEGSKPRRILVSRSGERLSAQATNKEEIEIEDEVL